MVLTGCRRDADAFNVGPIDSLTIDELKQRYDESVQRYRRAITAASTDQERLRIGQEIKPQLTSIFDTVLRRMEAQRDTQSSIDAAIWLVQTCDEGTEPHRRAAVLLLTDHPHPENLPPELYSKLVGYQPACVALLRLGALGNHSPQGKAYATFELAETLVLQAQFKETMIATPELTEQRVKNMGPRLVEHLQSIESADHRAEAKELYETVLREYADLPYRNQTLGQVASERLAPFDQTYAEIGMRAPAVDACDLDGNRLTLESLRGKVVVISFWASWCGSCLNRVPEENKIVEEFADADFVFMGVNGDQSLEDARRAVNEHSIRFNSWWDDPQVQETIVARWGVSEWPTTFVIDPAGKIRFKNLFGEELHRAVRELLESAKSTAMSALDSKASSSSTPLPEAAEAGRGE